MRCVVLWVISIISNDQKLAHSRLPEAVSVGILE